jgi:lipopolysaccharide transport system permease protein
MSSFDSRPIKCVAPGGLPVTLIGPQSPWKLLDLRELWAFRGMCLRLVWRDVRVRYHQTVLGVLWVVLRPVALMLLLTASLGRFATTASTGLPYAVYVLTGLLAWNYFAEAVAHASNSVLGNASVVNKVYFPRLVLPLSTVLTATVDFAVALVACVPLLLWYGVGPTWNLLLLPAVVLLLALAALGAGTLLAALVALFRDARHVVPFLLQFGLFATATIYLMPDQAACLGGAGEGARGLLAWGPLTGLVASFRAALLGGPVPWGQLAYAAAVNGAVLLVALAVFRRAEGLFADCL